jgi:hypothetical protein
MLTSANCNTNAYVTPPEPQPHCVFHNQSFTTCIAEASLLQREVLCKVMQNESAKFTHVTHSLLSVPLCCALFCALSRAAPVMCMGGPPPLPHTSWPEDCKDKTLGFGCKGTCEPGHVGSPTAVCQGKSGNWAANGGCKPAKCDAEDLPTIANATWASDCDKADVGEAGNTPAAC